MGWPEITAATNRTLAQAGAFGEAVNYFPLAGGGPLAIRGAFDEQLEEVDPDTGAGITSQRPNLLVTLADLPAAPIRGDRFVLLRTGERFAVEEVLPDGVGTVVAVATRAEP